MTTSYSTEPLVDTQQSVISDYPAPVVLENIRRNASNNIPQRLQARYSIVGHEWGVLDNDVATTNHGRFTRILAADCYWMPNEHANLVKSMLHFLAPEASSRVFAIAGFHTGRAKLAAFFTEAQAQGLVIEDIYEEDAEGTRRAWQEERDGGTENVTERKKWLVISRLRRAL